MDGTDSEATDPSVQQLSKSGTNQQEWLAHNPRIEVLLTFYVVNLLWLFMNALKMKERFKDVTSLLYNP